MQLEVLSGLQSDNNLKTLEEDSHYIIGNPLITTVPTNTGLVKTLCVISARHGR